MAMVVVQLLQLWMLLQLVMAGQTLVVAAVVVMMLVILLVHKLEVVVPA